MSSDSEQQASDSISSLLQRLHQQQQEVSDLRVELESLVRTNQRYDDDLRAKDEEKQQSLARRDKLIANNIALEADIGRLKNHLEIERANKCQLDLTIESHKESTRQLTDETNQKLEEHKMNLEKQATERGKISDAYNSLISDAKILHIMRTEVFSKSQS